jgi:hypothetical protein
MLPARSWILIEDYAGMRNQALGLAEAAGLSPEIRDLNVRWPWRHLAPELWPFPLAAVDPAAIAEPWPDVIIGCGGKSAAVLVALRRRSRVVIIQHPRKSIRRFDLVVAGRHDRLTGPNVLVSRTALHRVTPARLAEAAEVWRPHFAHLRRPLVAVLVGGSNGRFRLDAPVAAELAGRLTEMMRRDRVGVAVTPSRRTAPEVRAELSAGLEPLGGWVWDMQGENPYFGLLALADAIVVTKDSVSMVSEAVATTVPVLIAELPGRSYRHGLFLRDMLAEGRVRTFEGRFAQWPVEPLNDTPAIAAEMCRRLGY